MYSAPVLLALGHPLMVAVIGLAILALRRGHTEHSPYMLYFGLSYLAYGLGVTSQITLIPSSQSLNVAFTGFMYMLAAMLLSSGIVRLSGYAYQWQLPLVIVVVSVALRQYFHVVADDSTMRLYCLQAGLMLVMLHGAYLARDMRHGSAPEKVAYYAFVLFAVITLPRTLLMHLRSPGEYGFDHSAYWIATMLSLYVFSLIFGLALIITVMQRRIAVEQELSGRDTLTGLWNRRGFSLNTQKATKQASSYSLLVIDIDQFKQINDNHGHSMGDRILNQVAKCILHSIRADDIGARVGGDEFAVLMCDTDFATTAGIAERLRRTVEDYTFGTRNQPLHITVSVGAATFNANTPAEAAFNLADGLLYRAKQAGRNRVISHDNSQDESVLSTDHTGPVKLTKFNATSY